MSKQVSVLRTAALKHRIRFLLLLLLMAIFWNGCERVPKKGWMTYRNDNTLSAVTDESIKTPLSLEWVYKPLHTPKPAWYEPAEELPRCHFDNAHYVSTAGGRVFFGSTVDNKVYALDAGTGKLIWTFFTEGPVRTSPTFWKNRVYVGSDDGYVYCLKARNGKLVWKYRAGPGGKKILGNEHMISPWPVRTSVIVYDGIVYFGAGVFPHEGVFICALDAEKGSVIWENDTIGDRSHELMFGGISPQGYLLCSENILYVPSGRALPFAFDRQTGEFLYSLQHVPGWQPSHHGGTWALLSRGELITTTERNATPAKVVYDAETGELKDDAYAWYPEIDMVITPETTYIVTMKEIIALDWKKLSEAEKKVNENKAEMQKLADKINDLQTKRSEASSQSRASIDEEINQIIQTSERMKEESEALKSAVFNWKLPRKDLNSIILAGNMLFAGGEGSVIAVDPKSGEERWSKEVDGKALGLAVNEGRLFVSTDTGSIYCFREGTGGRANAAAAVVNSSPYPEDRQSALYGSAAEKIISDTGVTKGYCLVLDCGDGRLVYELAKRTEMTVIGIENSVKEVLKAKKRLDEAGLLGSRAVVESWDISDLPDYFANLIVSGELKKSDVPSCPPEEMYRVLKPCGGIAYFGRPAEGAGFDPANLVEWMIKAGITDPEVVRENGTWVKAVRGKLPGAGSWTQIYSNPENTACTDDTLIKGSLEVLWFGAPGPKGMVERHGDSVCPVSINGRLFVQGEETVTAYDVYNGIELWQRKIPGAVRVYAKVDGGNLVVTEDALYVAAYDVCYRLDPATGETVREYGMPPPPDGKLRRWGYISCIGNILYGSTAKPLRLQYAQLWDMFVDGDKWKAREDIPSEYQSLYDRYIPRFQKPDIFAWKAFHRDGSFFYRMGNWRGGEMFVVKGARSERMMTGDSVFALDTETGKVLWQHKGKEIAHITISIGDGKLFFTENIVSDSQKRKAIAARKALVRADIFIEGKDWKDHLKDGLAYEDIDVRTVYALDAVTGKRIWSKQIDLTGCCGDMMGSLYHKGMLFFFGHFGNHDAWRFKDGEYLWRRITAMSADKGDVVWSRALNYRVKPLLAGDKLIIEPWACDYRTGEKITRSHPITGKDVEWEFLRPGHCCSITSASESMLFYRSHSTGIFDIEGDRGLTIFGAIRPACFNNIIPANGLVLMPEASSGCTCSFPIKCSVAFIPREQKPEWTVFITHGDMTPVKHFSINLGAPADMKDKDGAVWFGYPNPKTVYGGNHFPNYGVKFDLTETVIEDMGYFAHDFRDREFTGTDKPWLFTSGCVGLTKCEIPLIDDTKEDEGVYTVRLGFMAQKGDRPGQRVFDIKLQGASVLEGFDVVKAAGAPEKPVIKEFKNVRVRNVLSLELLPEKEAPDENQAPVINFIEIVKG